MLIDKKNVILEVGSHNGVDGLALALLNPYIMVYSFEPNYQINQISLLNKKKIEKYFSIKIRNHKIIQKAVSNYNKSAFFYISNETLLSSLNKFNKKNIFKNEFKKKIKIKTIRLDSFCKQKDIKNILFLHIDTQGSDLNVLKGLGLYRKKVISGILETAKNKKIQRYENESTLHDVIKNFKRWQYIIKKKEKNFNDFEYNVYFKNLNFKINEFIPKFKTTYNIRFFRRILENRNTLKDSFLKIYIKYFLLNFF